MADARSPLDPGGLRERALAAARMLGEARGLTRLGGRVIFVGNGSEAQREGFIQRFGLGDKEVTVLTDPTGEAHQAAGLPRSVWGTYGPRALYGWARAVSKGHRYTPRSEGDV